MADVLLGRHGRSLQSAVYWSTPPLNGQAGMDSQSGQTDRELALFPLFPCDFLVRFYTRSSDFLTESFYLSQLVLPGFSFTQTEIPDEAPFNSVAFSVFAKRAISLESKPFVFSPYK